MCGITGSYNYKTAAEVSLRHIQLLNDSLSHRGPDGSSFYRSEDKRLTLGHCRLAIVDISRQADQPMPNEDLSIWLVFNGEIYNHLELRKELQLRGHTFRTTHCDTEVVIHAYEEWGMRFLDRLRGMYAFALWDEKAYRLLLVRDRIGIKPLYYTYKNGNFAFASEINALLKIIPNRNYLDSSIYHYLTFLTVPAPHTMYKGIYKLEAGSCLVIEKGEIHSYSYWRPELFLNKPLVEQYDQAYERNDFLVKDAINRCGIADVPISASLSSGVDSSIVAALLSRKFPDLLAITVDYEVPSSFSEAAVAQEIAAQLNIETMDVCTVTENSFFSAFNEYAQRQPDYPVGAQDIILFYIMAKHLNAKGYRVCVLGEGADECGGYPSYVEMNQEYRRLFFFSQMPRGIKDGIFMLSPPKWKEKLSVAMGRTVISRKHIQSFSEHEKCELWCGPKTASSYEILEDVMNRINVDSSDNFIRKVLNVEFSIRLPEFMLPRVDYPTMACSLEARVPFLDHHLVEYSLQLDNQVKMKDNIPKRMFKELLSNYVDEEYIYRKKIGFGKVITPLLNETLPTVFYQEIIQKRDHAIFSVINRKALIRIWEEHRLHKNRGFQLWTLFGLGKWMGINFQ